MKRNIIKPLVAAIVMAHSAGTLAKVSADEASKLGTELNCMGGEIAGNAAGTIPEFTGKWLGTPEGVEYTPHAGRHPVDPYADDKPLYVITRQNWQQYSQFLTEGQKAMFERYPDTFEMPVYPGRRDFRYPDEICDIAKRNATESELIDDGFGFTGYKGAVPFPIPDINKPLEVLANHNFPYRAYTYYTRRDVADVSSTGDISWGRTVNAGLNITNHPDEIGKPMEGVMAYSLVETERPVRKKGSATVTSEPVNFARGKRLAWNYNPGTRRVRQLPEYGFDTPLAGTSGKLTIDTDRLMNGSPERYTWKVTGKQEIFIPANTYKIHGSDVTYDDLLQIGHANPDYMRYELRRIWVLEGDLKEEYRHRYGKRVMYIDEDTWHGVISDYYDTRGTLVQHAYINYYYAFDMNAWQAGSSFYHDLTTGGYVGYNLFQEREKGPILNTGEYSKDNFTPAALRRLSH
ncbi:DUF1329 domain-containing protein [Oceanospirillum beijerinckii]|uniref:DUF1329 domain-containing protein n=1 Tax=Oceanospirillum beijerinckii TaxID=64976 RepID=UPI000480970D|nr:DUF1329 domain-containing protein [Oceanospirillum beijerinckii]